MIAHLFTTSGVGCDAFLGGISKNYKSNLLLHNRITPQKNADNADDADVHRLNSDLCISKIKIRENPCYPCHPRSETVSADEDSRYVVAEADEYDRSFLRLHPHIAVVTAMDADHLDIYGTHDALKEAFAQFASQITSGGILLIKHGLTLPVSADVRVFTYSLDSRDADFHAEDIRMDGDRYLFSLKTPQGTIRDIHIGVPGLVNVENGVAASAVACLTGVDATQISAGLASFEGISRRWDYRVRTGETVYMDDYAHHPEELRFTIASVRGLYPDRHITGVFQPHLYSRTRDFADEFAQSLSMLDTLILLDIYPAREEPIEGVTSKMIFDKVTIADKCLCSREEVINILKNKKSDVLLTLGAGDIDRLVAPIEKMLKNNLREHHF